MKHNLIQFSKSKKFFYPKLFDTTLRDGLQNADPNHYTLDVKKQIFNNIITEYNPTSVEIGSIVSPKILPIMADSLLLYNYAKNYLKKLDKNIDLYLLIPNSNKLDQAINHEINNFSFITSVSQEFQIKNTNKTIEQNKNDLERAYFKLRDLNYPYKSKLYISCITDCPISGKKENNYIISEILYYHTQFSFNEICLSDTCGTIKYTDFKYIVDSLITSGFPINILSLHLHVSNQNLMNIEKILFYCFNNKIYSFDISLLETGGCSVTMSNDKLSPNLNYTLFYDIFSKYLLR
jgi:isopropylmalate/homocitrate/citramalate synthase